MKGPIDFGPTGATAGRNVRRARNARGLSVYRLSELMTKAGRRINPDAISKLERGERRIDVDDLVALAIVLGVPLASLILPVEAEPTDMVEVTGGGMVPASQAWRWALGIGPLHEGDTRRSAYEADLVFRLHGKPHWMDGGES